MSEDSGKPHMRTRGCRKERGDRVRHLPPPTTSFRQEPSDQSDSPRIRFTMAGLQTAFDGASAQPGELAGLSRWFMEEFGDRTMPVWRYVQIVNEHLKGALRSGSPAYRERLAHQLTSRAMSDAEHSQRLRNYVLSHWQPSG